MMVEQRKSGENTMGCFSCVCIVSKLPIYGHPVVGIPIRRVKVSSGRRIACYPNTDWEIDGFPFFGDNDDYGRIEDYENGPYHELNLKRYGEALSGRELMDGWCQPPGDESIMFVHRPVWDKLMRAHKKEAERIYKISLQNTNHFAISLRKSLRSKVLSFNGISILKKVPNFSSEGCGFSQPLTLWCEDNYTPEVKKALIDLLAFDISCTYTHTIFQTTYTVGEQISSWTYEAKWYKFLASFAKDMKNKIASS